MFIVINIVIIFLVQNFERNLLMLILEEGLIFGRLVEEKLAFVDLLFDLLVVLLLVLLPFFARLGLAVLVRGLGRGVGHQTRLVVVDGL